MLVCVAICTIAHEYEKKLFIPGVGGCTFGISAVAVKHTECAMNIAITVATVYICKKEIYPLSFFQYAINISTDFHCHQYTRIYLFTCLLNGEIERIIVLLAEGTHVWFPLSQPSIKINLY